VHESEAIAADYRLAAIPCIYGESSALIIPPWLPDSLVRCRLQGKPGDNAMAICVASGKSQCLEAIKRLTSLLDNAVDCGDQAGGKTEEEAAAEAAGSRMEERLKKQEETLRNMESSRADDEGDNESDDEDDDEIDDDDRRGLGASSGRGSPVLDKVGADGGKPSSKTGPGPTMQQRAEDDVYGLDGESIDVWSFGICLYMMLQGQHPFAPQSDAHNLMELQAQRREKQLLHEDVDVVLEDARAMDDGIRDADGGNDAMISCRIAEPNGMDLLDNITKCELKFPCKISPAAEDLLNRILVLREATLRNHGRLTMREVMNHPWMNGFLEMNAEQLASVEELNGTADILLANQILEFNA
jgi:serine/threonine protein kinase